MPLFLGTIMDMLDRLAFDRWVEYYKSTNMDGISWPEWKQAWDGGMIR